MKVSTSLFFFWSLSAASPLISKRAGEIAQSNAPWNLRAISHRSPQSFSFINIFRDFKYYYDDEAGKDTVAYVIDGGIRVTHEEFEGRAENFYTNFQTPTGEDFFDDKMGHGTHVAGVIASKTYGVAKKARVLNVKVLHDKATSNARILAGFHASVKHAIQNNLRNRAVINLSIGGPPSLPSMNAAIDRSFKMSEGGIVTVVSAGNNHESAAKQEPAASREAITVGSIDKSWKISSFSNWGPEVDIFAPGGDVASLSSDSDTGTVVLSGTSMAAPHVAGLVLNGMSVLGKTSQDIRSFLDDTSTKGMITGDLLGSPNKLVNNNNVQQNSCKPDDKKC
ncbi:hypothetical protein CDD82_3124 [Ophiocordyceps australis]|uniref:Peptidase S8/S53 domain-containing protein n=1 Tax=Ophiocordyceps australis TaxID=1399860 RepID=A0A2C5Y5P1_9HYPO|nr:hypothetical protein CDD82_3124 [Ophiocordyceps australis]